MAYSNETRLVCVKLPADVCPTSGPSDPRYLSIIFESDQPPVAVGNELSGLPFLPHYETVTRACAQRAALTVDGSLRVNGQRIEPDAYIRRWRQALADAITVDQLRHKALQVSAEFSLNPGSPALLARPRWINPPYPNLAALVEVHAQEKLARGGVLCEHANPVWITLSLDLSRPNGARDAWWLDDGLDSRRAAEQGECRLCIKVLSPSSATASKESCA